MKTGGGAQGTWSYRDVNEVRKLWRSEIVDGLESKSEYFVFDLPSDMRCSYVQAVVFSNIRELQQSSCKGTRV